MAWKLRGFSLLILSVIAGTGCTGTQKGWARWGKPAPAPAGQPASASEFAEPAPSPDPQPTESATTPPATANNTDQVLAYIERLPSGREESPTPAQTPPPAAPATPAETPTPPATSANAPVSLAAPAGASQTGRDEPAPRQAKAAPIVAGVRIKSASPTELTETDSRALSTNEPLDATAAVRELSVAKYVASLEESLRQSPADVEAQWKLSAIRMAMGEEDKALEISGEIAKDPAGLLKDSIGLFAGIRKSLTDPAQPADALLAQLDALREKLSGQAELEIPVVALCSRVMTFGVYDQMSPDELAPHQVNRTIVYSEIKNFASRTNDEGLFETLLSGRLELLTKDGRSVWQHEEPQIKDVSRQRRGDFFLAQLVSLPADLGPGDYVLKVMIQDQLAGKANEGRLEFSVKGSQLTRK